MAGLEGKRPLSQRIFRGTGRVLVETGGGRSVSGRGIVSAMDRETGEPGGKRHQLGTLARPLYRFVGWLPETEGLTGSVLTQAGQSYRILDIRKTFLGERELCVRMLLERKEECVGEVQ